MQKKVQSCEELEEFESTPLGASSGLPLKSDSPAPSKLVLKRNLEDLDTACAIPRNTKSNGDVKCRRPQTQKQLANDVKRKILKCLRSSQNSQKKEKLTENHPVKLYCLSLISHFQKLRRQKQQRARIRIEQVFAELDSDTEVYQNP